MLKILESGRKIDINFRKIQLYGYPNPGGKTRETWTMKTSSLAQKPLYILIALATNRVDSPRRDAAKFDSVNIKNIRVFINEQKFPSIDYDIDWDNNKYAVPYMDFINLKKTFNNDYTRSSGFNLTDWKASPVFCFDSSEHSHSMLKNSCFDIKIEFDFGDVAAANNTNAYALIVFEEQILYSPFSSAVEVSSHS